MTESILIGVPIWPSFAREITSESELALCDKVMFARLPSRLRKTAEDFVLHRRSATAGCPLLGEVLPWIVRDLNGDVETNSLFIRKCTAWLQIYYAVMMADDCVDTPLASQKEVATRWLVSHLFLQSGVGELIALSPCPERMSKKINEALADCATATSKELDMRASIVGSEPSMSIQTVGKKFAVARICSEAFYDSDVKFLDSASADSFWQNLCVGLQLLDDLTDLESDWQMGNMTRPVSRIVREGCSLLSSSRASLTSSDAVLISALETGALEEILLDIQQALQSCVESRKTVFPNSREAFWIALGNLSVRIGEILNLCQGLSTGIDRDKVSDDQRWTGDRLDRISQIRRLIGVVVMYS